MDKYFLVQIKRTNGTIEKGIAVKDSLEDAEQGFHAYLSAYGFGHEKDRLCTGGCPQWSWSAPDGTCMGEAECTGAGARTGGIIC